MFKKRYHYSSHVKDRKPVSTGKDPTSTRISLTQFTSLRSALGLVQYLSSAYTDVSFTKHFAVLSQLLKKTKNFVWGEEQKEAWRFFQNSFDETSISFGVENPLKDSEYWVLQIKKHNKYIRNFTCRVWETHRCSGTSPSD